MPISEEYFYACPYCSSENSLLVDYSGGSTQKFITDCEICCRPISIKLHLNEDGVLSFEALTE
ncbi:MAG: CPXCG motif-containing cysteine-rich protein [Candidatus Omnitrophica bacterium]|nr:CPXCG motif-containing cysteine-rich protein [Candidatus Omnitrophota bacterium]